MNLLILGCALLLIHRGTRRRLPAAADTRLDNAPTEKGLAAPIRLELLGAMLDAGLSVPRAVSVLADVEGSPRLRRICALLEAGLGWDQAWGAGLEHPEGASPAPHRPLLERLPRARVPLGRRAGRGPEPRRRAGPGPETEMTQLREALDFAVRTGAPAAALLRSQAARLRRSRHRDAEKHAAALGVRLMLPLGLCSLPAFICLGVVPVLIGLVPALW